MPVETVVGIPISVGVFGLRLVGSLLGKLAAWMNLPYILVAADAADPFVKGTPYGVPKLDPLRAVSEGRAVYYRLRVENNGRSTATACRLQLIGIRHVRHAVWARLDGWEPIDLNWSNRPGVTRLDLSARESAFCDVGHVFSNHIQNNAVSHPQRRTTGLTKASGGHAVFMLDSPVIPSAQASALPAGPYVLELRMFSSNARTADFYCLLHFVGEFASLVDHAPPGTIFRIDPRPPEVGAVYR